MNLESERRTFQALRIVSFIFRGLAYLGWVTSIGLFALAFIAALTNPRLDTIGQAATSAWLSAVGPAASLAVVAFFAYAISQVVDLFVSIHEHLQAIRDNQGQTNQELVAELKRTNGLLQIQYKRLGQLYQRQQRRLDHLEQERKP